MAKLKALERATHGRIRVVGHSGSPISKISLKFLVRTAADDKYPTKTISEVDAAIQLGARYPFEEPAVSISTKVFNPNIYTSGRVCLGSKWIATEYLDLLAQRLFKILAFDEGIINTSSAANGDAARWYIRARASSPGDFPSDSLLASGGTQKPTMSWMDKSTVTSATIDRVLVACPHCRANLRIPAGKTGNVACPSCNKSFPART
ncbi:MAG: ubiquitin-conjugating enzyme E2 [Luteimonas sp.]